MLHNKAVKKATVNGFSLIESLIVLLIGSGVILLGGSQLKQVFELNKITKRYRNLEEIERSIRLAIRSDSAWSNTESRNPLLLNCINGSSTCLATSEKPLADLRDNRDRTISGGYTIDGKKCKKGCPISADINFQAYCSNEYPCKKADTIVISYYLSYDKLKLKQGSIIKFMPKPSSNPELTGCGPDDDNNPMFINKIVNNHVDETTGCVAIPIPPREISGIDTGFICPTNSILSGFTGAGAPICKKPAF